MTIADALKRIMHEEGINNISLAQLLNLTPATTCRYLTGSRIPTLKRLIQISLVLNRRLSIDIVSGNIQAKFQLRETVREVTFDQKLQNCRLPLWRYCISSLDLRKEDAEDVVQETLYRALKLHYTLRPEIAMMTWLIGIAKIVKGRKASKLIFIQDYIENDVLTDETEEIFRQNIDLFKYIERLNPKKKQFYKLYLAGLTHSQIAEQMNTTEAYSKERIKSIKRTLKQKIEMKNVS